MGTPPKNKAKLLHLWALDKRNLKTTEDEEYQAQGKCLLSYSFVVLDDLVQVSNQHDFILWEVCSMEALNIL